MERQKKNYTLKILENGKVVSKISTHSVRKFTTHLSTINWTELTTVYLRISYGKALDKQKKITTFYNDCWCNSEEELLAIFEYFRNESLRCN